MNDFHSAGPNNMSQWFLPPYPAQRTWNKLAHLMLIHQGIPAGRVSTDDKKNLLEIN